MDEVIEIQYQMFLTAHFLQLLIVPGVTFDTHLKELKTFLGDYVERLQTKPG
jgi:hypothetical protein